MADLDLRPEPGQPLLVAQEGQPVAVGVVLAAELPEQLVGPLEMLVGGLGVVPAVEIGDGIRGDPAPGIARSTLGIGLLP